MISKKEIALAKVGLDALIDEATGYQKERFKDNEALKTRHRKHLLDSGAYCQRLIDQIKEGFVNMEIYSPNDIRFFVRRNNFQKDIKFLCSSRLFVCPYCGKNLKKP